jgi:sialate O-acetylesterase
MHLKRLPHALLCGLSFLSPVTADVSVPTLFSDHMVLQREKPVKVWGWAEPGESVNIKLNSVTAGTITSENGQWMVELPAMPAGGPYTLHIIGNNELVIEDVLVGEVWIASGQSNMQWTLGRSTNADLAQLTARTSSGIRFNRVRNMGSQTPKDKTDKVWEIASSKTVGHNSGVAYAFAKTLHQVLGVPIGIIDNSWGSSTCEAWVDRALVANDPLLQDIQQKWLEIEATYDHEAELAEWEEQHAKWEEQAEAALAADQDPPKKPNKPINKMIDQPGPARQSLEHADPPRRPLHHAWGHLVPG